MPTFAELLSQFSYLASTPAAFGAVIAVGLIVIFFDWRILVLSYSVLAIASGLLFSNILPPQIAGVKMMVGLLIAVQMWATGRQMEANHKSADSESPVEPSLDSSADPTPARRRLTTGLPFRLVVVVMVLLTSWQASLTPAFTLPDVTPTISLAVIGLIAMGLLGLGLTEEPLKAGMLLLAVLMGFELYYSAVEPALAVMALLAAMNFAIALAACYLAVIKSLPARRPHGNAS
jgi:hypothetical protein